MVSGWPSEHGPCVLRQHTRQAFEEGGFSSAVRTNQAKDFAGANRKIDAGERRDVAVPFREAVDADPLGGCWRAGYLGRSQLHRS